MTLHIQQEKALSEEEIAAFRNQKLVKSFYRFIEMYDLRTQSFRKICRHMTQQEEEAKYEDL